MTAPVDVGEIGHITSCHHPVEELHGLHGWYTLCPHQQCCGDEEHYTLKHHHRFVTQPVRQQEDWHQHRQVGVRPHRENLIVYLARKHLS